MIEPVYIFFLYVALGIIYCFKTTDFKHSAFIFFILVFWSLGLRTFNIGNDFLTYSSVLDLDWKYYLDIYYLREPLYWFSSKFLYEYVVHDKTYVFFLLDVIFFTTFLLFIKKNKLPEYLVFLFILFFPSILGIQNVYRQFLATFFIIYAIFNEDKSTLKSFIYLFVAFLLHGVAILFVPFIFLKQRKYLSTFFSFIILIAVYSVFGGDKSNSDTGDVNPAIYLLAMFLIFLGYALINNFKIKYKGNFFINSFFLGFILYSFSIFLMGSGQSKRVGMIVLLLNLFSLIVYLEKEYRNSIQNKVLIRILVFFFLTIITIVVPSSRNMLLGG
ncbi:EpsG family protein [Acinetobacter genomosp. 15BJ]|uniref:EpsG family protein n=1 Tax=Acinetobacter genomosp. 15BJ TaxID=106651 RepID=A0ABT8V1I7_9GAMM|nr:EpsG family protein [Acinetobacter genomosp. 15BJ]MDO3658221.1 EpsG family protein [Acinetobacter genomosp. 15BJ]